MLRNKLDCLRGFLWTTTGLKSHWQTWQLDRPIHREWILSFLLVNPRCPKRESLVQITTASAPESFSKLHFSVYVCRKRLTLWAPHGATKSDFQSLKITTGLDQGRNSIHTLTRHAFTNELSKLPHQGERQAIKDEQLSHHFFLMILPLPLKLYQWSFDKGVQISVYKCDVMNIERVAMFSIEGK